MVAQQEEEYFKAHAIEFCLIAMTTPNLIKA